MPLTGLAADGVGTYDGYCVGGHCGEEEGDDGNYQKGYYGVPQVVQNSEVEENEHQGQSDEQTDDNDLHRQVSLGAGFLSFGAGLFAAELLAGQTESGLDDAG